MVYKSRPDDQRIKLEPEKKEFPTFSDLQVLISVDWELRSKLPSILNTEKSVEINFIVLARKPRKRENFLARFSTFRFLKCSRIPKWLKFWRPNSTYSTIWIKKLWGEKRFGISYLQLLCKFVENKYKLA